MKHIFIMNHSKKHLDFEKHILDVMNDYDYQIIYTHTPQEVITYFQDIHEPSRVYSVGGDGTLNSVVQAVVNTDHELVVIPLGTGNDFCRTIYKERDPVTCLKESLKYKTVKVDTIQLNDYFYINSACFGVDSVIGNHVHDTLKIKLIPQSQSYIISILKNIFSYQFDEITIYEKDQCLYQGQITLCTFNNGKYYGGGFMITPEADIQDGYIDVCVADKVPKYKIPYLFTFLLRHQLHRRKEVHYFRVQEVIVITKQKGNVDGDEYQSDSYHLKIQPSSVNMVIYQ